MKYISRPARPNWRSFECALVIVIAANATIGRASRLGMDHGAIAATSGCPERAVVVTPGADVQATLDEVGPGGSVCLDGGTFRITQALEPRTGQTLVFDRGTVLNGSKIIKDWAAVDGNWVAQDQTQSFPDPFSGTVPCEVNPIACEFEDLYVDGRPLRRVGTLPELKSGTFYFDEAADEIYVRDDPSDHLMEATVADSGIVADGARDVVVRGATIENFAYFGIVSTWGWRILDSEVRWIHSHGLRVFHDTKTIGNFIHDIGNMGIFGMGDGLVFKRNELARNNRLRFGRADGGLWHAGAIKIVESNGVVFRNNNSHDNVGDGLWIDGSCIHVRIVRNVFERNDRHGVLYEISFSGLVRDNVFERNVGSGLWVNTSSDVEVDGNTFRRNRGPAIALVAADRGSSEEYGPHEMADLFAHHNRIVMTEGYVGVPFGLESAYEQHNHFNFNRYVVDDRTKRWWKWKGTMLRWRAWRSYGHDRSSSLRELSSR